MQLIPASSQLIYMWVSTATKTTELEAGRQKKNHLTAQDARSLLMIISSLTVVLCIDKEMDSPKTDFFCWAHQIVSTDFLRQGLVNVMCSLMKSFKTRNLPQLGTLLSKQNCSFVCSKGLIVFLFWLFRQLLAKKRYIFYAVMLSLVQRSKMQKPCIQPTRTSFELSTVRCVGFLMMENKRKRKCQVQKPLAQKPN